MIWKLKKTKNRNEKRVLIVRGGLQALSTGQKKAFWTALLCTLNRLEDFLRAAVGISRYIIDHSEPEFSWNLLWEWLVDASDFRKLKFRKTDFWSLLFFIGMSFCTWLFLDLADVPGNINEAEPGITVLLAVPVYFGLILVLIGAVTCVAGPLFILPLIYKLLKDLV